MDPPIVADTEIKRGGWEEPQFILLCLCHRRNIPTQNSHPFLKLTIFVQSKCKVIEYSTQRKQIVYKLQTLILTRTHMTVLRRWDSLINKYNHNNKHYYIHACICGGVGVSPLNVAWPRGGDDRILIGTTTLHTYKELEYYILLRVHTYIWREDEATVVSTR